MRARPLTPAAVVAELAERIAALPPAGQATRVLVDGPPSAEPVRWAEALVGPLQKRGRPVLRASAEDFLRPASLRLERGRTDSDAFYADRLDTGALSRELLGPLGADGSGRVLPRWWDATADRSARASYTRGLRLSDAQVGDDPLQHAREGEPGRRWRELPQRGLDLFAPTAVATKDATVIDGHLDIDEITDLVDNGHTVTIHGVVQPRPLELADSVESWAADQGIELLGIAEYDR